MNVRALIGAALSSALLMGCVGASGPILEDEALQQSFFRAGHFAGVHQIRRGPGCTIFHPINMNYGRHPVIIWGNGTYASPADYRGLLEHWAIHGFVVVAAMSPNAGTGREMGRCMEYMLDEYSRRGSPFQGKLNTGRIGVAGHSQGGGGAINLGRDMRITTVVALQPFIFGAHQNPNAATGQRGPMLLLSGSEDTTARPETHQQPIFDNTNIPVTWLTLRGATHLAPMFTGGSYRGAMTAWFRMHLLNDKQAARMFEGEDCVLCEDERWTVQTR